VRSRNSAQHCQRLSLSRGQPPDLERISPTSSLIAAWLSPEDLSGGTYSISNNGAFGTTFTAPIINAPQVGILSTDAIRLRPAVAVVRLSPSGRACETVAQRRTMGECQLCAS
jgi:hypothetical protein